MYSSCLVSFDTFFNWKLRGDLGPSALSSAGAFEDVDRQILFDFFQVCAIPITQPAVLIEKGDFAPFTLVGDEFTALDRLRILKNALEVRVAELAKDLLKLIEKFGAVFRLVGLRRRQFALALTKRVRAQSQ